MKNWSCLFKISLTSTGFILHSTCPCRTGFFDAICSYEKKRRTQNWCEGLRVLTNNLMRQISFNGISRTRSRSRSRTISVSESVRDLSETRQKWIKIGILIVIFASFFFPIIYLIIKSHLQEVIRVK